MRRLSLSESESQPSKNSSVSCVQSVWDDRSSKTWTGSRCEVDSYVVKGESARIGSLCICAQVSEMESDGNRTIPGCIPHQNLGESICESLPLERAMALHGVWSAYYNFISQSA